MPSEGIQESDVAALRREVETAIGMAVERLRSMESESHSRMRYTNVEQRHLEGFLDELDYRLHKVAESDEPIITITGTLSDSQVSAMLAQQNALHNRKAELAHLSGELEQMSSRLSWLVHQMEGAAAWVLSPYEGEDGEQSRSTRPDAGEQVIWAQIIMGQEAERARLAREIHDGPAQVLANTLMRLQLIEQMARHQPESVEAELPRARLALQESMKDMRRFIFNLRPASLADAGLLPTLRLYTQDYSEQFGVPVELNLPENLVLSSNQELAVFRIVQEALQNIHKHAEATRIEINVQQRLGGPLVVMVSDDGKGFDARGVRRNRPASSGLVSMKERASTVGGTLKIDSKPGVGTVVTLTLPMPKG